ncbi:hypothetical protein ACWIVU_10215, partial [Ursidibacter arcticus]
MENILLVNTINLKKEIWKWEMKVLILNKWLIVGGVEKVLINYLDILKDKEDVKTDLFILFNTDDSVFSK